MIPATAAHSLPTLAAIERRRRQLLSLRSWQPEELLFETLDGFEQPGPANPEIEEANPEDPPTLANAALLRLADDTVRDLARHAEADSVSIVLQFLAAFGNLIVSAAHALVGSARHGVDLFVILVGEISKARKGITWRQISSLFAEVDPNWAARRVITNRPTPASILQCLRDQQPIPGSNANDSRTLAVDQLEHTESGNSLSNSPFDELDAYIDNGKSHRFDEEEDFVAPNKIDQLGADVQRLSNEIAAIRPAKKTLVEKSLTPFASILLGVLTPVALVQYVFKAQISELIASKLHDGGLDRLPGKLDKLQGTVDDIKGDVTILLQNALKTTASLTQSQFNQNLKAVSFQIVLAKQLKPTIDARTQEALRARLLKSDQLQDESLWKSRVAFLAYESANYSTVNWRPTGPKDLGLCDNAPMSDLTYDAKFTCRIDLDGMHLRNVIIANAVVKYSGKPTFLENVTLVNCYLFLEIQSVPDKSGQKFLDNLLASTPASVSISG